MVSPQRAAPYNANAATDGTIFSKPLDIFIMIVPPTSKRMVESKKTQAARLLAISSYFLGQ
jgi:hypothetical protein